MTRCSHCRIHLYVGDLCWACLGVRTFVRVSRAGMLSAALAGCSGEAVSPPAPETREVTAQTEETATEPASETTRPTAIEAPQAETPTETSTETSTSAEEERLRAEALRRREQARRRAAESPEPGRGRRRSIASYGAPPSRRFELPEF